jgi:hypothetical protein
MSFLSDSSDQDDDDTTPAPAAATIALNVAAEPPENSFVDNYHIDNSDDDDLLSEKMVHYVGGHVLPEHWIACKATLVFYAGSTTTKSTVMTKRGKEDACLEVYKEAIANLDTSHFSVECKSFFLHSFKKKDDPIGAGALWRYYQESRTKMRCSIIPLLPANFCNMKSGKGFHDTFDEVFRSQFRRELQRKHSSMTVAEIDQALPPLFWEYKKSPWYFGLTVKIFRRHPQLAPDVHAVLSDIANAPQSRAEMLRQKQQSRIEAAKKKVKVDPGAAVLPTTNNTLIHQQERHQNQVVWAKVRIAKAMEQNSNVTSRLGRVEELEKTLNLLERIRPVIGEAVYKERIDCLAASLPNLDTYKTEVEVIVIDDDEVAEDDQNHSNHDSSSSDEESINCSSGSNKDNDSPPPETTTPAVSKQLFSGTNSSKKRKSSL